MSILMQVMNLCLNDMKAMIFAAGLGTRLKPLTDNMPKAMVPICGRPLLEHAIFTIASSGIDDIVVNVHHFAAQIEDWVAGQDRIVTDCRDKEPGKVLVHISDEREKLLETGGAVLHARKYLDGCGSFLVHNVDILSDCDLGWFCSRVKEDALATLLVSERKTTRYFLFHPDTMRLTGWCNTATGETVMADETIDAASCRKLAFSGIHIMSDEVFDLMEEYVREKVDDAAPPFRFPIRDFYLWAASRRPVYGVEAEDLQLLDVGKLDALAPAEDFISRSMDMIH